MLLQLALENLAIMQAGGAPADAFFKSKPDFVPCKEFCGERENYTFTTRFHKKCLATSCCFVTVLSVLSVLTVLTVLVVWQNAFT